MEVYDIKDGVKRDWNHPVRVRMGTGLHHPLSEIPFEDHLCHERMRAERSGRTIALLLIDCRECFAQGTQEEGGTYILRAVCEATRLTDIVGWYRENAIIGVLLTEFGNWTPLSAVERIQAKITPKLSRKLYRAQIAPPRVKAQVFPEGDVSYDGALSLDLTFYPELMTQHVSTRLREAMKRFLDLSGSSVALVSLLPLFAVIAAAIRLSSPGPALFKQKRVGRLGVDFTMYKFRTMHSNAESGTHEKYVRQFIGGQATPEGDGGVYKMSRDPRVTRLGKFLRRTSLDELPQLLNVLQGSMSLVGPRPPLRYELERYKPWHRKRLLESKPGLTGLWQVSGRSRTRFDEMVRLDLRYSKTRTFVLDLKLILKTFRALISDDSAC